MPVTDIFCEQGPRPLQELQRDKGGLFLVYQTQLDIALKVALRYSRVEELEVVSLRVICDWLSRFKQKTKTDGSERDNIEKRGTTVSLARCHLCEHITHCRSGLSRYRYLEGDIG